MRLIGQATDPWKRKGKVIYFLFRVSGGISRIPDEWHPANHSAGMVGFSSRVW